MDTHMKHSFCIVAIAVSSILTGCQTNLLVGSSSTKTINDLPPSNQTSVSEQQMSMKQQLDSLLAAYQQESFQFSPISATFQGLSEYNDKFGPEISAETRDNYQRFEQKFLDKINAIESSQLNSQDQLTYKIFKGDRESSIESNAFPGYLVPINQMSGMHNFYAVLGSGQSAQPFNTEKDYRNFMKRSIGFARWMDSVIESMKMGKSKGVVLPKAIVEKLIPQLSAHVVSDVEKSVFFKPLMKLPEDLSEEGKQQLLSEYKTMINMVIIPAYSRVHDFIVNDYQQSARESVGLSALPNGKSWYEFMIKTHTTLPLTAKEIHEFGLSEVSRILSEMKKVKERVNFEGDLAAFFVFLRTDDQFYFDNAEDLIKAYEDTKSRIDATLPQLFNVFPKADYVVKAVPDFQAASAAGASYQSPSPDGSRPGVFYINTHNLKSQPKFLMETLSIHEAAPGHHFQIAIQQEVEGLPDFRKYGGYTVFNEGWALYAESLGKELGLFTDPYMWYGRLVDEQLRAMRLVVDTGLHAYGWSREQSIQYMLDNSSMALSDVEAEVERYIVMPGQAVSYKVGQRKIRELRTRGEKLLGDKFDIKQFHSQMLVDGSLPMLILEDKIEKWLQSSK